MIPKLAFGNTGHVSSRTILGAAAFGSAAQHACDRTLDCALSFGVNHVDTAANYGESELRIGDWIKRHGNPFFIGTKTAKRTRKEAAEEIQRSLERLKLPRVDLIQLHYLVDQKEWETALGPGGALEAAIEARDKGLVRFIGVTGHDVAVPTMHLKSLERFAFDSVLLPFSYVMMQNPQYAADFERLRNVCVSRNIAMQTIKSLVRRPYEPKVPHPFSTWYMPLTEQADIDAAVHWVLGHEGVFLNTAGDVSLIPKVLDAASRFTSPPDDATMRALVEKLEMKPLFV
ncbi:MAG TPA: aldo/keto reductase [Planctomycetota bacterium]|nr:aldo/keto reductase [Planctomycetota bacterium]